MSANDVLRESCADCPNPLQVESDVLGHRQCMDGVQNVNNVDGVNPCDTTWCTGNGDCEIHTFKSLDKVDGRAVWSIDTCVSKYIFEVQITKLFHVQLDQKVLEGL